MANEVTTTEGKKSALALAASKIADGYLKEVSTLNASVGVPMSDEAKRCATNAVLYLCAELGAEEVRKIPAHQTIQVLQFVSINCLDVNSGQVFLDKRFNKREGRYDVRATPMGNAYEIMVRRFGVDVKTVHQAKIVHEGDEFTLPQFDGLKTTNIVYKPTLKGLDSKAIAVYYVIEKTDGTLDYAIATRDGVAKNLMAQILNATLREESVNRGELMKKLEGKSLDELLADPDLQRFISPAYRSPASRESMIITKMKKNALLHYTRDLGSKAFATEAVSKAVNEDAESDMLASGKVVSFQDGDDKEPVREKPAQKIQNFEVDEDGVVDEKPEKQPQNPVKTEVKAEEPVKEAKPEPEVEIGETLDNEEQEPKTEQVAFFDVSDL